MHILTQTSDISIQHEYEAVELVFRRNKGFDKNSVRIGDFYGDPECAMISFDESFCAVGGCGLIIYWIKNPLEEFQYDKRSDQYQEYFRDPNDIWWIENIYEGEKENRIRFVVDPSDERRKGVYELNVLNGEVEKLI